MTCTQAEIHRLMDLIEYKVFDEEPKPKSINEVYARFREIVETVKAKSLSQLKDELGL